MEFAPFRQQWWQLNGSSTGKCLADSPKDANHRCGMRRHARLKACAKEVDQQDCCMTSISFFKLRLWEPYVKIFQPDLPSIMAKIHRHHWLFIRYFMYNSTYILYLLNFTRSWVFWIFRVYWVSKSKCIISSNLRAEGSWGKVLNVVIFVESVVVHRWNWPSREVETVGNSRKQSGAVLNSYVFAESKVRAPTVSNCFPLHFQKKRDWVCADFFFLAQKWRIIFFLAWSLPTVSDCFSFFGRLVSPVDHWFNKNHNIQHFSSRPFCAQVARNDAFWLWNPIYPKNPKSPRPREI